MLTSIYTQGIAAPKILHAHARGCTECSHDGCSNRCYDLYDEFNGFSLCHGISLLIFRSALPLGIAKNV